MEPSGGNSAAPEIVSDDGPMIAEVPEPVARYPHMSVGKASDKRIYLNDLGVKVMLDKRGRPYPVGWMASDCFPAPDPLVGAAMPGMRFSIRTGS